MFIYKNTEWSSFYVPSLHDIKVWKATEINLDTSIFRVNDYSSLDY